MSQFSKNISSANKLITAAVGSNKASEKFKKYIQETPKITKPKIQQNVFEENLNLKSKEEGKIPVKKSDNTNKTKENIEKNENIPNKISANLIEESEKNDDKNKNTNKIINKNPAPPLKKQTTTEKTGNFEAGLTSLEKIASPKFEKTELSHKTLPENVFKKTKKRKKFIGNRKNIFEFHDFDNFLRKIEDFGFFGDEEQKFQDEDYLISTENGEIIDSQKLLGVFNTGDFNEELVKRIEWVEISRVSEESRLTKFINRANKNEISIRQKIVKGKLDDNAVLKSNNK